VPALLGCGGGRGLMPELDWDVILFLVALLASGVLIVMLFSLLPREE
jgi:hypothetical protein